MNNTAPTKSMNNTSAMKNTAPTKSMNNTSAMKNTSAMNNTNQRPKPKYKVGQVIKYKKRTGIIDEEPIWCDWLNFYEGWYYRISYASNVTISSDAGVMEYQIELCK